MTRGDNDAELGHGGHTSRDQTTSCEPSAPHPSRGKLGVKGGDGMAGVDEERGLREWENKGNIKTDGSRRGINRKGVKRGNGMD